MDLFKRNRELIARLYEEEGMTAAQLSRELETNYGFPPTNFKTFEKRLRSLRLRKKLKRGDWRIVYSHLHTRDSAKASSVFIHGIEIPREKVWKEMRRNRAHLEEFEPSDTLVPLPDGVEIRPSLPSEPATYASVPAEATTTGSLLLFDADAHIALTTPSNDALFGQYHPAMDTGRSQDSSPQGATLRSQSHQESVPEWSRSRMGLLSRGIHRGCLEFCLDNYQIPWRRVESWISRLVTPGPNDTLVRGGDLSLLNLMSSHLTLSTMSDMELQKYGARVQRDALDGSLKIQYSFESLASRSVFQDALPVGNRSPGLSPLVFQQGGFEDFGFLARLLYQLSNDMVHLGSAEEIHRFLQTIFDRFPTPFLTTLFQVDLPTVKAAWQQLTVLASEIPDVDLYRYLIRVGPNLSTWSGCTLEAQFIIAVDLNTTDITTRILKVAHSSQKSVDICKLIRNIRHSCWFCSLESCLHSVRILLEYSRSVRTTQNWTTSALSLLLYLRNGKRTFYGMGLEELETCRGLILTLVRQGADVDAPDPDIEFREYTPEVRQKLVSWQTLMDCSYFLDPQLHTALFEFTKVPPDSARLADAIKAARESRDQFVVYLDSRRFSCPQERLWFLEVVIDAFFSLPCLTEISYDVWEAALTTGIQPDLSSICNIRQRAEKIEIWSPLYELVKASIIAKGNSSILHLISLFISHGAVPGAFTLCLAVQSKLLLRLFAQLGVSIKKVGTLGVIHAAALDDYDTVDMLYGLGFHTQDRQPQLQYLADLVCAEVPFGIRAMPQIFAPTQEMVDHVWSLHASLGLPGSSNASELFYLVLGTINICDDDKQYEHRLERCKHLVSKSGLNLEYQPDHSYFSLLEAAADHLHHHGLLGGNEAIFNYLLEQGAPTSPGMLVSLIESGRGELVSSVLDSGIDLTEPDGSERTPIRASIERGDMKLFQRLLHCGAKIDMADTLVKESMVQLACHSLGWTPQTQAFEMLQFFVNMGVDVNSSPKTLPLATAARAGHIAAVMFLLENGAEVNKLSIDQRFGYERTETALDSAARAGRLDVVQFLLNVGAKSARPGKSGYCGALHLAKRYPVIVDLIRSHVEFIWGEQGTAMIHDDLWPTCFR